MVRDTLLGLQKPKCKIFMFIFAPVILSKYCLDGFFMAKFVD